MWIPCYTLVVKKLIYFSSDTTCITSGTGTANLSGAPECTPDFSGVGVARSFLRFVDLCIVLQIIVTFCPFSTVVKEFRLKMFRPLPASYKAILF